MDLILQSLQSSPIAQVLNSESNLDNFLYELKQSMAPCSRNKYYIDTKSGWDFGKTTTYDIPRFGVFVGAVLKLSVDMTSAGANTITPKVNHGSMIVARASLSSNSREIEQILDVGNWVDLIEKPLEQKIIYNRLAHNSDTTAYGNETVTYYIPLNFSCLKSGLGSCLNTAFCENLSISIEAQAMTNVYAKAGTGAAKINTTNSQLMVWFYNLDESTLRSLENQQYSVSAPTNMCGVNYYRETAVTDTADHPATGTSPAIVNLNCPNVMKRSIIYVTDSTKTAGEFVQIDKLEIYASGRLLYEYKANEEILLEDAMFFGANYGLNQKAGADKTLVINANENVIVHNWQIQKDPNKYAGGISGKGCSQMQMKVYFTNPVPGTNACSVNVIHEYVQVTTVSGASGKVSCALSL